MTIGYARISIGDQTLDLKLGALATADGGKGLPETAGGALVERASFDRVAARSALTGKHLEVYAGA